MDLLPALIAGTAGIAFGWFAARYQHLLYRQPEYHANPAQGRKLLSLRLFLATSTGLAGALAFRPDHYDAGPALLTLVFAWVLCVQSSTDFERRIIPNRLTYPAIAGALLLAWAWPDRGAWDVWLGGGIGLAAGVTLFLLGTLAARGEAFGMGDVKLMTLVGLLSAWPAVVPALFIGVLAAGIPGLALTLAGRGRSYFSYGPYLAFGGLVAILFPAALT